MKFKMAVAAIFIIVLSSEVDLVMCIEYNLDYCHLRAKPLAEIFQLITLEFAFLLLMLLHVLIECLCRQKRALYGHRNEAEKCK